MIPEILKNAEKIPQMPGVIPPKNHVFAEFGGAIPEKTPEIHMVI